MAIETVKVEGLSETLKVLESLPRELVSSRGGPVRSALRRAALEMRGEVLSQLQRVIAIREAGEEERSTGLLQGNVVIQRGGQRSVNGEQMVVRIRNKPYPNRTGKGATTAQVARLLEYGRKNQPAAPFLRPAFEIKKAAVVATFAKELNRRVDALVRKLEREKGAR